MDQVKILAIGNSFSQDATAQIELLTDKLFVRNMYIGGCSLEKHLQMTRSKEEAYEYQICGMQSLDGCVSLEYALTAEKWNYITVQQVSHLAGVKESYYPYITELIEYIRQFSAAKIIFHQTWAYEKGSQHSEFYRYDKNQKKMWESVRNVSREVCSFEKLPMIECGETFAKLRENEMFDIEKGGISLCRDNFHASLDIGRFALACTWIKFFTGELPAALMRNKLPKAYELIKNSLT